MNELKQRAPRKPYLIGALAAKPFLDALRKYYSEHKHDSLYNRYPTANDLMTILGGTAVMKTKNYNPDQARKRLVRILTSMWIQRMVKRVGRGTAYSPYRYAIINHEGPGTKHIPWICAPLGATKPRKPEAAKDERIEVPQFRRVVAEMPIAEAKAKGLYHDGDSPKWPGKSGYVVYGGGDAADPLVQARLNGELEARTQLRKFEAKVRMNGMEYWFNSFESLQCWVKAQWVVMTEASQCNQVYPDDRLLSARVEQSPFMTIEQVRHATGGAGGSARPHSDESSKKGGAA